MLYILQEVAPEKNHVAPTNLNPNQDKSQVSQDASILHYLQLVPNRNTIAPKSRRHVQEKNDTSYG